jgi:hypothetical protein
MAQTAPNTEETLAAFVQRRRQVLELTQDQLTKAFHAEGNRIREERGKKPVNLSSTQKALRDALSGLRGMNTLNQEALSATLRCNMEEIRVRARRRRLVEDPVSLPDPKTNTLHQRLPSGAIFLASIGKLGDTAELLNGIWKFFYIVPASPQGKTPNIIRGNIVFFKNIDDQHCELFLVGQDREWRGHVFGQDAQLYFIWREVKGSEFSFTVSNMPTSFNTFIVGLITIFDNPSYYDSHVTIRPATATLLFGEKYSKERAISEIKNQNSGYEQNTISAALDLALDMQVLTSEQTSVIRGIRMRYTSEQIGKFKEDHSRLWKYLCSLKLNNEGVETWESTFLDRAVLRVSWP